MKLMLIADEEADLLWDRFSRERLQGVEMILSCGDLDPDYLTFLATMFHGRWSTFTEITMDAIFIVHQRGVSARTASWWCARDCGFWD
jgi:hypothetical protein